METLTELLRERNRRELDYLKAENAVQGFLAAQALKTAAARPLCENERRHSYDQRLLPDSARKHLSAPASFS